MNKSHPFDKSRPFDLICMGRVAVDFYADQIQSPLEHAQSFSRYLGGCAGNISVGTSRLGLKSAMFSCVGTDDMGVFLRNQLQFEGVDTSLLRSTPDHLTGLVVLGVSPPDRFPLIFYRETKSNDKGEGFSAKLWSIDLTGYNERQVQTETDASDPSWSSLLSN